MTRYNFLLSLIYWRNRITYFLLGGYIYWVYETSNGRAYYRAPKKGYTLLGIGFLKHSFFSKKIKDND